MKKKSLLKLGILAVLGGVVLGELAYLQHPKFGAMPHGERLLAVKASPNYRDGAFRNLEETPLLTACPLLARRAKAGRPFAVRRGTT